LFIALIVEVGLTDVIVRFHQPEFRLAMGEHEDLV
jgi:hypothetical protein